ncbi:hypothetical protein [Paraglaciecola sp. 25GB23A]|uniref:hypothetical protein n=1 Tax=Paraglaciecola sp. 25GB23A TaxID=3156068 RepID=UPI0032AFFAFC
MAKALQPNPFKRYQELSEFIFELRQPSQASLSKARPPLVELNPVAVWQMISFILALMIVTLLIK